MAISRYTIPNKVRNYEHLVSYQKKLKELQIKKRLTSFMIITGDDICKTKADVIVLIQDSQGINTKTVDSIKTVVRRLLTLLGNETQDYNFALATYASSRRMSCFGSAADTKRYMDREYQHG